MSGHVVEGGGHEEFKDNTSLVVQQRPLPCASACSEESKPVRGKGFAVELPESPHPAESDSRSAFAGRWLVISTGGECLVDHPFEALDEELAFPTSSLCSLVAAMLQFSAAASGSSASTVADASPANGKAPPVYPPTQVFALSNALLVACRGEAFSLIALLSADKILQAGEVAYRYKALEAFLALSFQLGADLSNLSAAADEKRKLQLDTYTLCSMLDSGGQGDEVQSSVARLQASSREILSTILRRSYGGLLDLACASLGSYLRPRVDAVLLFDAKGNLAAITTGSKAETGQLPGLTPLLSWKCAELTHATMNQQGFAAQSLDASEPRVWAWTSSLLTAASHRIPLSVIGNSGPLRVALQASVVLALGTNVALAQQTVSEVPLSSVPRSLVGIVVGLSKCISAAFSSSPSLTIEGDDPISNWLRDTAPSFLE